MGDAARAHLRNQFNWPMVCEAHTHICAHPAKAHPVFECERVTPGCETETVCVQGARTIEATTFITIRAAAHARVALARRRHERAIDMPRHVAVAVQWEVVNAC